MAKILAEGLVKLSTACFKMTQEANQVTISVDNVTDPATKAFIRHLMVQLTDCNKCLVEIKDSLKTFEDRLDAIEKRLDLVETRQASIEHVDPPQLAKFNMKIVTTDDTFAFGTRSLSVNRKQMHDYIAANELNEAVLFVLKSCYSKEDQKIGLSESDRLEIVTFVMKLRNKFVQQNPGEGVTATSLSSKRSALLTVIRNRKTTLNRDSNNNSQPSQ